MVDEPVVDEGKNAIYHSFDFRNPEVVSAGTILNLPERDEHGNLLYLVDEYGEPVLDWQYPDGVTTTTSDRARLALSPSPDRDDDLCVDTIGFSRSAICASGSTTSS